MFQFLNKLFDSNEKQIQSYQPFVDEVNALEKEVEKMSQDQMIEQTRKWQEELNPLVEAVPAREKDSLVSQFKEGKKVMNEKEVAIVEKLDEIAPKAFAMVREVARRKYDRWHFDVQILAAKVLAEGKIGELKTGEGKTQVAWLPLYLYGLTGRGAHLVTVNDYLTRAHGEYAGHILSALGLTVGVIEPRKASKFIVDEDIAKFKGEEIYRERMKVEIKNPGDGRGWNLLECQKTEAYKCDVVYGTNNEMGFDYLRDNMARRLDNMAQRELYYCIVDEVDSILVDEARTPLIISAPAEQSNELYMKFASIVKGLEPEKEYTVDEKARSAVLTDEGVERVEKILGVENLWENYQLAHHLENALKAETLYKRDDEYLVKENQVLIVDQFTGRVLPGRRYSEGLHQAIEAKEGVEIKQESKTLATITFQNYFRLYKHLAGMTGTAETEAEEFFKIYNLDVIVVPTNEPVIRIDYNDQVYKNGEAKFRAVVREIKDKHEKGQPMLVGTTSVEISEYLSRLLQKEGIKHTVLNAKHHEKEAHIVEHAGELSAVTIATNMAGRGTDIKLQEGLFENIVKGYIRWAEKRFEEEVGEIVINVKTGKEFDIAKKVIANEEPNAEFDENKKWIKLKGDKGGETVKTDLNMGLHVIGTERHEARRIDNQLRGRSGRQGDPGSSRFYVALDDEIMRLQGGHIVQSIMERTRMDEDIPLEAAMVGRSIETAQKRMEGYHFDIRKHVVDYDDVMSQQREIFYTKRRDILEFAEKEKEKLKQLVKEKLIIEVEEIVKKHFLVDREDQIDKKKLLDDFLDLAPDELLIEAFKAVEKDKSLKGAVEQGSQEEIEEFLKKTIENAFGAKVEEFGDDESDVEKHVILQTMDQHWTDHLEAMQDLREGVGLRGIAQRDPLVEYKNEGFELFDGLMNSIDSQVAHRILKIQRVEDRQQVPAQQIRTNVDEVKDFLTGSREMMDAVKKVLTRQKQEKGEQSQASAPQEKKVKKVKTVVKGEKVGRNDPCPCGSGKKYKKCCGR